MNFDKIQQSRVFKASDNTNHDTITDAKIHECGIEMRRLLVQRGVVIDAKAKEITSVFAAHYDTFREVLNVVNRLHAAKKGRKV